MPWEHAIVMELLLKDFFSFCIRKPLPFVHASVLPLYVYQPLCVTHCVLHVVLYIDEIIYRGSMSIKRKKEVPTNIMVKNGHMSQGITQLHVSVCPV